MATLLLPSIRETTMKNYSSILAQEQWEKRQRYQRMNPRHWRLKYQQYFKDNVSQQTKDMIAEQYGEKWLNA